MFSLVRIKKYGFGAVYERWQRIGNEIRYRKVRAGESRNSAGELRIVERWLERQSTVVGNFYTPSLSSRSLSRFFLTSMNLPMRTEMVLVAIKSEFSHTALFSTELT